MDGWRGAPTRTRSGESIWVYDHFHTVPVPSAEATHEAWTLMAAFAASTARVRLGQMCTCMAYRIPRTCQGRRHRRRHQWRARRDGHRRRVVRARVAGLWLRLPVGGRPARGAARRRRDLPADVDDRLGDPRRPLPPSTGDLRPRPLQGTVAPGSAANGIPMWVAGGGEKKTLRTPRVCRLHQLRRAPEGFAAKSEILRGHCADVGRDFGEITRSANYNVVIGETETDVEDRLQWMAEHFRRAGVPDRILEGQLASMRTQPAVGTIEQVIERLRGLQALGMTYAICYFQEAAYDTTGITTFENAVIPELDQILARLPGLGGSASASAIRRARAV